MIFTVTLICLMAGTSRKSVLTPYSLLPCSSTLCHSANTPKALVIQLYTSLFFLQTTDPEASKYLRSWPKPLLILLSSIDCLCCSAEFGTRKNLHSSHSLTKSGLKWFIGLLTAVKEFYFFTSCPDRWYMLHPGNIRLDMALTSLI